MAKKSTIEKEKKRQKLTKKYLDRRMILKNQLKQSNSFEEKALIVNKLQALPKNSSPSRIQRRCFLTGRPRGVYRDFELSRHVIREMAHMCLLPGVTKSSW